jgi:hypothetical protein
VNKIKSNQERRRGEGNDSVLTEETLAIYEVEGYQSFAVHDHIIQANSFSKGINPSRKNSFLDKDHGILPEQNP